MRNFTYNGVKDIAICTALPTMKTLNSEGRKSIAVSEQTTSDLGFLAAEQILNSRDINPEEIGAVVFLSKTPDYRGPATAMILQNRLQIPQDCVVYDSPMGNAGFENACIIGASLLNTISKPYVLVVLGDTISKQLSEEDINKYKFQDGATAIVLENGESSFPISISTLTLSDAWSSFMVPSGGFRPNDDFFKRLKSKRENQLAEHLHLDYSKILGAVKPELHIIRERLKSLIAKSNNLRTYIVVNLVDQKLEKELASLVSSEIESSSIKLSSNFATQTMASTIPLIVEELNLDKTKTPFQLISVSLGEGLSVNIGSLEVRESTVLKTVYSDSYYDNGFVTHEM